MSMNLEKRKSISLEKGKSINLSKTNIGLSNVMLGLGWDVATTKKSGLFGIKTAVPNIDCDASAFMLSSNGKLESNKDIVYFGNLISQCGSVKHTGDNLTGHGDGDDESLVVNLKKVPDHINEIVFVVTIYQAKLKRQHFGMIENAFIRIVDKNNNKELAHFNLTEDYKDKTALIFGSLKKVDNEWTFKAIGEGTTDGSVSEVARRFK